MYAIEHSIPVPASRFNGKGTLGAPCKYPFRQMKRGDSFAVPCGNDKPSIAQTRIAATAGYWAKKLNAKFATRITGEAVRVWRVA